jgi:uncharacterized protein (DUF1501 family)
MRRRKFLTAAGLASAGMLLPVGCSSWIAQSADTKNTKNSKRLVVVFLRGAVDGLNIVVPHQSEEYYQARPTIAIADPGTKNGAIDLDGFFGLHPKLDDLIPLWKQQNLAFIQSSGSPIVERSHFQAQDYIENGTPGNVKTLDGWMNRLLAQLPQEQPTQALNVALTTPYILKGKMAIANLKPGKNSTAPIATDRIPVSQAFNSLYDGTDELSKAFQAGTKARKIVLDNLSQEMKTASRGAANVNAFVDDAAEVARLMVSNARTQLAFMQIGGWDTHINQNSVLDRLLPSLGLGLATLAKGLEPIFSDTVIVVISEFGRTVKENGTKGTDHGYGNAMWLLGGAVRGGKIYGDWSGLEESALDENRDLPVTTDYRSVFSTILQDHLSVPRDRLEQVFPGYKSSNPIDFLA